MKRCGLAAVILFAFLRASARCAPPLAEGTKWEYEVTDSAARERPAARTVIRVRGREESDGRSLVRLETETEEKLVKTELVAADARGLFCYRRISPDGQSVTFGPPLLLYPSNIAVGTKWEVIEPAELGGAHQEFSVTADEEVAVPAGKFHAFRVRLEQPWPVSVTADRWFVPEIGFVKEVTTTRGPNGRLLSRTTSVLTKFSPPPVSEVEEGKVAAMENASPSPLSSPKIQLELAKERESAATTEFRSDVPNIFIRWSGENLPVDGTVRIAWIAEDVGDVAPANFIVDETEVPVNEANLHARFTLSRPKDGWAAGKYRVEFYLNDELMETVRAQIND